MCVQVNKSRTAGFSIVELVAVVGLLILIAAIVLPVFVRAKKGAKASACIANLSQIGKAVELYRSDYDQFLPPVTLSHDLMTKNSSDVNTIQYKQIVGRYGLSESQWFCPLDSITNPAAAKKGAPLRPLLGDQSLGRIHSSYRTPSAFVFMADQKTGLIDYNQISNPAEVLHILDAPTELIIHQPYNYTITAHGQAANVLYLDGHVKLKQAQRY